MTEISYSPRLGLLCAAGHAGAGEKGADLVCAALSILAETAAALPGARVERGEGFRAIEAEPAALSVLALGFRLLARDFPEHVSYEEDAG